MQKPGAKTYYFSQAGCLTRQMESQAIEQYLQLNGWTPGDLNSADLILAGTCAVTQDTIGYSLDRVQSLTKRRKAGSLLVITGCLPAIDKKRLEAVYAGPVISPYSLFELDTLLNSQISINTVSQSYSYPKVCLGSNTELGAYVIRINYGCGHFCSYCGIRKVYPKIKSRKIDEILSEIRQAVARQVPEICLVSEDLTAYGKDQGSSLMELLAAITELKLKQKIALPRIHPDYIIQNETEFVKFLADHRISVLGLVINSASPRVLELMRRRYDVVRARSIIEKTRELHPQCVIRSDFLIGHPGETEADFLESLRFFLNSPIDLVAVSKFSLIPGTPAEKMEGHVSAEVIQDRFVRFHQAKAFLEVERLPHEFNPAPTARAPASTYASP